MVPYHGANGRRNLCKIEHATHGTCTEALSSDAYAHRLSALRWPAAIVIFARATELDSSLLRRCNDLPIRNPFVIVSVHVASCQWNSIDILCELNLEHSKPVVPERSLEPGKVVLPHPNESVGAAKARLQARLFLK